MLFKQDMFGWLFKKKDNSALEKEIKNSFSAVKDDMASVGKWIKHLDSQDKRLSDEISALRVELSAIKDEMSALREGFDLLQEGVDHKQMFENLPVSRKQTTDLNIEEVVQIPVQTDNIYEILKRLSGNERLIIFTLLNSEVKLSYEDLALLLGKDRSTIRGQVNMIRQKAEGLIDEITEKSGKKRVFVQEDVKHALQKYAKVRMGKKAEK